MNDFKIGHSSLIPFSFEHIVKNTQLPKNIVLFLSGIPYLQSLKKITLQKNNVEYFHIDGNKLANFNCISKEIENDQFNLNYGFYLVKTIDDDKKYAKNFSTNLFSGIRNTTKKFVCSMEGMQSDYCEIFYTQKNKKEIWTLNDLEKIEKITSHTVTKAIDDNYFVAKIKNFDFYSFQKDAPPKQYEAGSILTMKDKLNNELIYKKFEIVSLISYAHKFEEKPEQNTDLIWGKTIVKDEDIKDIDLKNSDFLNWLKNTNDKTYKANRDVTEKYIVEFVKNMTVNGSFQFLNKTKKNNNDDKCSQYDNKNKIEKLNFF